MNIWNRFFGILGLVFLGFGFLGGLLSGSFTQPLMLIHTVVGLGLLGYWAVTVGFQNLGHTGELLTGRAARFGANASVSIIVVVGILVAGNFLITRHNKRWDLTEEHIYSLSPQTGSVLRDLPKPLKLVSFKGISQEDPQAQKLKSLFDLYAEQNPTKISTEVIDPRSKPQAVSKYQMKQGNLVYIEYGDEGKTAVSRINETTEDAITNAVLKLTRGEAKKIYFVEGHDEPTLSETSEGGLSRLSTALGDDHLTTATILLSKFSAIPQDAATVVLVSPKKPLLPAEKNLLISYAESGGRLLLLTDPRTTSDVQEIANHFGIQVGNDVIIDEEQHILLAPASQPVFADYDKASPITKNLTSHNYTVFNVASTVTHKEQSKGDVSYADLVKSSAAAWGETNLTAIFDAPEPTAAKDANDLSGPVTAAISYEKKIRDSSKKDEANAKDTKDSDKVARVVVFGDSDWITNQMIGMYSNRDLFLNSANWLAGEEGGVSIRAGSIKASTTSMTLTTLRMIAVVSFFVPELLLIFGLLVWWRRRALSV